MNYYPILTMKEAELWALSHLDDSLKSRIVPVFVIPPVPPPRKPKEGQEPKPPKKPGVYLKEKAAAVSRDWKRPCYIDAHWFRTKTQLKAAFAAFKEIPFTPVINCEMADGLLEVAKEAAAKGVLIRCKREDSHDAIVRVLNKLKLSPGQSDLLIDFGRSPADIDAINRLPDAKGWKTLICASGVFPPSLADLEKHKWHSITRSCWLGWKMIRQLDTAPGNLRFSDYGSRSLGDDGPTGEKRGGSSNVRYSTPEAWKVMTGRANKRDELSEMPLLCKSLIKQSFFEGRSFSAGDAMFEDTAYERGEGAGGPTQWIQWSLNHHLTRVCLDLQKLS